MLKAALDRLAQVAPMLSKAKRESMAKKGVDMYIAIIRKDVKEGKAYVEADHQGTKRASGL